MFVRFVDETTGFLAPGSIERFRTDLGIDYTLAGMMFAAGAGGGILANIVVARSDGRSRKPIVVGGAFATAAGLAVFGLAMDGTGLLLASALVAAGATAFVHGGEITLVGIVPDERLEHVLARANLTAVAGDIAGPALLAASRAAGIPWRSLFVAASIATAIYGLLLQRLHFPTPVAVRNRHGRSGIPRLRLVALIGVAGLLIAPLDESLLAIVLAFAERQRGFSPTGASLLGIAFVSGGLLSFTVLPALVARSSATRLLVACGLGMAAATVGIVLLPGWAIVPLGVAHSAILGAAWLGMQARSLRAMPGEEGRALLVIEIVETFSLLLVVAIGVVADRAGLGMALVGFAVIAATIVLPAIAIGRFERRYPR